MCAENRTAIPIDAPRGGAVASEHVWWNPERARDILEKILQDVQELTLRHLAQKPAYPVGAAGQGFSHLGERIADSLTQLHHRGERRAGSLSLIHI